MNTKEPSTLMSPVTFRRDIHPDLRADYVLGAVSPTLATTHF